jgi:predicted 2-oxoglutarate/Fe(II)-dependent dioxygenase YbiX
MEIADGIYTFQNVYSLEECREFIALSENIGYESAPINVSGGAVMSADVRTNARVILDDETLAEDIWSRVKQYLPRVINGRRAIGLNERLRFYRYDSGEKFELHVDGYYMRPNGEQSMLTFMLYLNDGFEGGETNFQGEISVKPEAGMILVFRHAQYHEGAAVTSGRKYVLRSDVMFSL